MKFCSECAHPVELMIPAGDNRPRYVCTSCTTIHYQNPKMVLGSIPVWEQDAVQARDRAALWLLDPAGGFHGKQ
jgi:hypothetical protein